MYRSSNEELCQLLRQRIIAAGMPVSEMARRLGPTCHRLGFVLNGEGMVTSGHLVALLVYFKPGMAEARTWLRLWTESRFVKTGAAGLEWVKRILGEDADEAPPSLPPAIPAPSIEGELEELRLLKRTLSPVARAADSHYALLCVLLNTGSEMTAEEVLSTVDKKYVSFAAHELSYVRDCLVRLRQRGFVTQRPVETRRFVDGKPKMQPILLNRLTARGQELALSIQRKMSIIQSSVAGGGA